MKDKFSISLVWHNCKTYPPEEEYNGNLYVTDGKWVFEAIYYTPDGWFDRVNDEQVPLTDLHNYWWADIEQTVQTSKEFAEVLNKKEVAPNE